MIIVFPCNHACNCACETNIPPMHTMDFIVFAVAIKVFLGCLRMVRFTNFLAVIVFWELSFFIRKDNKLAFLEKNPLKHALLTLQHYTKVCFASFLSGGFTTTMALINHLERELAKCISVKYPSRWQQKSAFRRKQKTGLKSFFKTAIFLLFYKQNQTTVFTSFYSKSLWNGLFADSLGILWSQSYLQAII